MGGLNCWREKALETRSRIVLAETMKIAALERREQGRRFAWLDEDGQHEVRPFGDRGPLASLALKTGIRPLQVCLGDNAEHAVGSIMRSLHNVGACGNFPCVDVRDMAERFQLKPDPVRPFAILAGIANEYVRHARCLS